MLIQNATKELIPGGIFVFIELGKRRTIRRRPMVFKHQNTRFSLQYFNILPGPESQAMVFGHIHANTDAAC